MVQNIARAVYSRRESYHELRSGHGESRIKIWCAQRSRSLRRERIRVAQIGQRLRSQCKDGYAQYFGEIASAFFAFVCGA
jgi:hypothetical protein